MSNAIKFTPEEGAIRLKTSLLGEENGVCTIKMEVSDTGIGISEEQQAKLFQAFQQAESSTTRSYGGTGLGLAISKRIVEMMGGDIIVDSALGKGTLISFTVKAERGAAEPSSDHLAIDFKNMRILAVDDDPEILAGLQEIITRLGADCTVAQDAKEALSLVKENGDYDIYFFDLRMPRIGGISLALELRAREKKPGGTLVMMTSFADLTAVEQDALCAGVNMFLLKPIFPAAIADTISECVGVSGKKPGECGQNINGIFAGRHILLVEDVDINREIVMAQLEPTQIGIDCAENGAEAVEMFDLEPEKYDLIFMDIQMPKLDGYDATRRIRELGNMKSQQIPIIAMTANVFKEDVDRCLEAGMNAHIGKPVDFDEVMRILKKCFGLGAFCA